MKNLENYGVVSLDSKDLKKTEGGSFLAIVVGGLIIAAGAEIIGDWDNFKQGCADAWNA